MSWHPRSGSVFFSSVINSVTVLCSNTAGQWNQVFVQPPPEEEVHIGVDQDPRVRRPTSQSRCVDVKWLLGRGVGVSGLQSSCCNH